MDNNHAEANGAEVTSQIVTTASWRSDGSCVVTVHVPNSQCCTQVHGNPLLDHLAKLGT